jgi:hypothetical protein
MTNRWLGPQCREKCNGLKVQVAASVFVLSYKCGSTAEAVCAIHCHTLTHRLDVTSKCSSSFCNFHWMGHCHLSNNPTHQQIGTASYRLLTTSTHACGLPCIHAYMSLLQIHSQQSSVSILEIGHFGHISSIIHNLVQKKWAPVECHSMRSSTINETGR